MEIQLHTLNKWFNLVWQLFTEVYNLAEGYKPGYKILLSINCYDTVRYRLRSQTISIFTPVSTSKDISLFNQ